MRGCACVIIGLATIIPECTGCAGAVFATCAWLFNNIGLSIITRFGAVLVLGADWAGAVVATGSGAMFSSLRWVLSVVYTVPVTGVFCRFNPNFQFKTGIVGVLLVAGVADWKVFCCHIGLVGSYQVDGVTLQTA